MSRLPLLVLLATPACLPSAKTVTQDGTVPAPRAMAYDGQPLDGPGRFEARATRTIAPLDPRDEDATDTGNLVATTQTGVAIRGARGDSDLGVELDFAWTEGADEARPGLRAPDAGFASQVVLAGRHSFRASDEVRIGVGVGLGFVSVPIRTSALGEGDEHHRDEAGVLQLAVVPSWRRGPLAIYGNATLTNDVVVPRTFVVIDGDGPEAIAEATGTVLVLAGGVSYAFDEGVKLSGQIAQPIGGPYGEHGMQIDLGIGFDFGR